MCAFRWVRAALALSLFAALSNFCVNARAEPILRGGIGLQSCEKLAADIKPADGFNHLPNALLFYWVQGYLSAANIFLLNEYTDYVDVGTVKPNDPSARRRLLQIESRQAASQRDRRLHQEANKIEAKESDAFDPWEH